MLGIGAAQCSPCTCFTKAIRTGGGQSNDREKHDNRSSTATWCSSFPPQHTNGQSSQIRPIGQGILLTANPLAKHLLHQPCKLWWNLDFASLLWLEIYSSRQALCGWRRPSSSQNGFDVPWRRHRGSQQQRSTYQKGLDSHKGFLTGQEISDHSFSDFCFLPLTYCCLVTH